MRVVTLALFALFALSGCRRDPVAGNRPQPSASASATAAGAGIASEAELLRAEHDRNPAGVRAESLIAIDPKTRLLAVRTLARMADEGTREQLLAALADEDPEIVSWAAFGLGHVCKGGEDSIVRALTVRAVGLSALLPEQPHGALGSIARALGRCANEEAERTLRAWLALEPPLAEAAALALGTLGMRRGRLDAASFALLLDSASRGDHPLDNALFAFGRLSVPEGPLAARLLEVATRALTKDERPRRFALRALGRSGPLAVPKLRAFAERSDISALERAEALRELTRIGGADAAHALAELLPARLSELGARVTDPEESDELNALLALLDGLTDARARPALERLARWPLPDAPAARHRAVLLRCAAARLLADKSSLQPDLAACDPDPAGRTGKLAVLRVLDRGELTEDRAERFRRLAADADPVVRAKAIELLSAHKETKGVVELLSQALSDTAPGPLASAAELLAEHPDRAQKSAASEQPKPEPALMERLTTSFRLAQRSPNIEVRSALIDAAGALGALSLKPEIIRDCNSDNPTLRSHAERALRAFGEPSRRCERAREPSLPPEELERLVRGVHRLKFETDAGELFIELDAALAPVAVTRLVELAKSGFFTKMRVHRVVPGFVVQFGDPGGDGYGGVERRALRNELGPAAFEPGAVGVALSGPDTGSSQIFVTLGSYPHLDGEYSRVGKAGPGWERLVIGDRLLSASVEPPKK